MRRTVVALLACSASACGAASVSAPTASDAAPRSDAIIEPDRPAQQNAAIGTGRDRWVAVDDGDALTVIHGPQGGYHLLVRAMFGELTMPVMIRWTLTDPSDESAVWAQAGSLRDDQSGFRRGASGWESDRSELLIFQSNRLVSDLYGRLARLRVSVQGAGRNQWFSAQVTIRLVDGS